jgi:hypothetical protein
VSSTNSKRGRLLIFYPELGLAGGGRPGAERSEAGAKPGADTMRTNMKTVPDLFMEMAANPLKSGRALQDSNL